LRPPEVSAIDSIEGDSEAQKVQREVARMDGWSQAWCPSLLEESWVAPVQPLVQ